MLLYNTQNGDCTFPTIPKFFKFYKNKANNDFIIRQVFKQDFPHMGISYVLLQHTVFYMSHCKMVFKFT